MGPPDSHGVPRAPRYSGYRAASLCCAYRPFTVCGATFQTLPLASVLPSPGPTTPARPRPRGFGLLPGRSPLLGESLLFSLPPGTKMFQFPGFASAQRCGWQSVRLPGCPIRTSPGHRSPAPHRSFSQLAASFIAFQSQGIRRAPFLSFAAGPRKRRGPDFHLVSLLPAFRGAHRHPASCVCSSVPACQ